jgi:hypothetical protein
MEVGGVALRFADVLSARSGPPAGLSVHPCTESLRRSRAFGHGPPFRLPPLAKEKTRRRRVFLVGGGGSRTPVLEYGAWASTGLTVHWFSWTGERNEALPVPYPGKCLPRRPGSPRDEPRSVTDSPNAQGGASGNPAQVRLRGESEIAVIGS